MINKNTTYLLLTWLFSIAIVFCLLSTPVIAAVCSDDIGLCQAAGWVIPTGVPTPVAILGAIIRLILGIVGVIFFIMILYAGYNWMTAAGNEEKIRSAKIIIAHATIALAIILGSYVAVNFVLTNLQQSMR